VGILTRMYENNQNEGEIIYGKVLRETRNLALVWIDSTNGAFGMYFIIEKENHIGEEYHRIYDKFFEGVYGIGNTEYEVFTNAYNDKYAMRDREIYEEIEELEDEENEIGTVAYGKLLWETKNLALIIIILNESLKLYLVIEKPSSTSHSGILGVGNTKNRAFISAYNNTYGLRDKEIYKEIEELEKMAFEW